MKSKHRKTLVAIYTRPTPGGVVFADIEALVRALDGEIHESEGSRIVIKLRGFRLHLHRPHPGKEAKKYQVEDVRAFLEGLEIKP
jgi:hypothetical protein